MHTSRGWSIPAAGIAVLVGLFAATPAFAEDPVSFGSSPVVDTAGVLGGGTADVERALVDAANRSGRQLFVAYVDTFTNPEAANAWADDTAVGNNMGDEDYLLAVAVDGRAFALSAAENASVSDAELDRIRSQVIEPRLRAEDWAGAATAAADALAGGTGGGGFGGWGFIVFLVVAAAIVVVIVIVVSRRRRKADGRVAAGEPQTIPLDDLRRQAGSALVSIDDAVRTSEEELGFAVASYGDEATAAFRDALETAKAKVAQAFALQQQLDDATPDSDEQRRAWYTSIIALTGEADAALDEQAEHFDELRDLERNAPQELERVKQEAAARAAKLAPAAERLAALRAVYAETAVAPVADNPAQAQSRLAFATESTDAAAAAIAAGETGDAAVSIRAAEEAVDQANGLTDAVDRLAETLATADRTVADGVVDLENDVRAASAFTDPSIVALAQSTAAEASALRIEVARTGRDPIALQTRLEQVNARIDGALGHAREAADQAARAAVQLDRALANARAQVASAEDYLVARRGAIGPDARTRLAEAGRLVSVAEQLRPTDPAGALQNAQRAEQLAASSMQLAQQDVGGYGGMPGGGMAAPGGGGGDVMGAVLGGILINSMLGGGNRGGGVARGGGFGGGGFGGSGGSSRSTRSAGSFGGSSTRGRRTGGGRF